MFVLEVVFKEVTLDGEPIIIPGVFMFSKQDRVTFNEILDMLLQAEPSLRQAPWVFSDGCKTLGEAIDAHFPLAFHGVDRNHVEQNIYHFMRYEMELDTKAFRKWKHIVSVLLRGDGANKGLYDFQDRREAAAFLRKTLVKVPDALRHYIEKNKSEILLGVLSQGARKAAGLVRENGQIDHPWSQSSESAHMVLNRWLEGETPTYKHVFDAVEAYFDAKITALNLARHGSHPNLKLKSTYAHLEFDKREFARQSDNTRTRWVHINRTDLKDKDGNLGLQLNTTSYKIIPQQVVDDETQRQNLATLVPTRQTPSNIQQHVIDKKIQFSKLEEAAVKQAVENSLRDQQLLQAERDRLDSRITTLGLVSGDELVRGDVNCGPDTLAAWLCARAGFDQEYWETHRSDLSLEVRTVIASFLKNNPDRVVPGMSKAGATLTLLPRTEQKTTKRF